jgi:quercetin dioxygenase-like cupin family protein
MKRGHLRYAAGTFRNRGEDGNESGSADLRTVVGWTGSVCCWLRIWAAERAEDYRGVQEEVLATIDLAKEIDLVDGRELRVSRATVAPGGHIGLHSHQGDPTIVYVLGGTLTNHHDDRTTVEFRAGQAFTEFGPRSHWVENNGTAPAIFIAANIHHRQ